MTTPRAGSMARPPGPAERAAEAPACALLRMRMRGFWSACRQVLGLPDYERYLIHAAEHHPGAPVLSRAAFCKRELDRKYSRGGARCC